MAAVDGTQGFGSRLKRLIDARLEPIGDWRSIVDASHSTVFVWDGKSERLLAFNSTDLSSNDHDGGTGDSSIIDRPCQIYVPTNPPLFDVRSVVCNATCRMVALSGRRGIAILFIPMFSSTTSSILCKSVLLAQRLLVCSHQTQVVEVKWHPATTSHNHVLVLFSDNHLRLYDVWAPKEPTLVVQLGQVPTFRLSSSSSSSVLDPTSSNADRTTAGKASVASLLGDTAVDFDFGNSTYLQRPPKTADTSFPAPVDGPLWPVYVLRGNGDIYAFHLPTPETRSVKCELRGPLTMYPSADDNYGVDACAIISLRSDPVVLAIATSAGTIYHTLVLPKAPEDDDQTMVREWSRREIPAPNSALYVYESVELQLILVSDETGSDDSEAQNFYIRLHRDVTTRLRYHCSHATGVHSVALPLVAQLQVFGNTPDVDAWRCLAGIENQECVVEHVICTKTFANSSPLPIVGLGVCYNRSFGGSTLLCLTSDFHLCTAPLVSTYLEGPPQLLTLKHKDQLNTDNNSRNKEPFDAHVARILKRNASNPIIKTKCSTEPSSQEAMQLLQRVTQVLREEYIDKLELAREEIQRRVKILQRLKQQQLKELDELRSLSTHLKDRSCKLSDTLETLQAAQVDLTNRCVRTFQATEKTLPIVSDAQRSMGRKLKEIAERVSALQLSLQQARVKLQYNFPSTSELAKSSDCDIQSALSSLDAVRMQSAKAVLEKQGQALSALVRTLRMMLSKVGL